MNPPQLLAEVNRRDIPRFYVASATATLILIAAAAVLLTTFEVVVWEMRVLVKTLTSSKVPAPVRRLDRAAGCARYDAHSYRWRTTNCFFLYI
jgi:hypothetical protein